MISNIKKVLKKNDVITTSYHSIKQFYYRYLISDEKLIKTRFKKRMGREVDLENPVKYNDKLQWLKLNWYDPTATKCADKYEVREFVSERIGEQYLNDLLAVYESVDEIDIDALPDEFVLKGTHGSGFNIICRDKLSMNWNEEFKKMRRWLSSNYYYQNREWVYKDIKPRIICEKFIETEDDKTLKDYKFFCFDGDPKFMSITSDRGIDTKYDFYDLNFNSIPVTQHYPKSNYVVEKPKILDEVLECAKLLSKGFPHVRVDFYLNKNKIIFGELTFFHFSGMEKFQPEEYENLFGEYIDLKNINIKPYKED